MLNSIHNHNSSIAARKFSNATTAFTNVFAVKSELLKTYMNPGFDFSQAQFSGNCPDPRTFMGGIRSD
ncbi:hypothetical protein TSUD_289920 [Trifolium subterraneum]|uniref:Uncharacterized protein n=1 Tax=Trifolium subterraneum TaxID=3900 RepID=A0A2Z6MZP3_TRISU|nr:hypothetical protein TSUD_289920 [Trifolium subterraneum]